MYSDSLKHPMVKKPKFSRAQYEYIALIIANMYDEDHTLGLYNKNSISAIFSNALRETNPSFDPYQFRYAARLTKLELAAKLEAKLKKQAKGTSRDNSQNSDTERGKRKAVSG